MPDGVPYGDTSHLNPPPYEPPPYGDPPLGGYGTPPPFLPHVYIDGARKPFTPDEIRVRPRPPQSHEEYVKDVEELEKRAAEAQAKSEANVVNLDQERIDKATEGALVAIDPTPLGPITVVVDAKFDPNGITFNAPVKALKTLDNSLVIVSTEVGTDDEGEFLKEWPIATFRKWDYVYRNDHTV